MTPYRRPGPLRRVPSVRYPHHNLSIYVQLGRVSTVGPPPSVLLASYDVTLHAAFEFRSLDAVDKLYTGREMTLSPPFGERVVRKKEIG